MALNQNALIPLKDNGGVTRQIPLSEIMKLAGPLIKRVTTEWTGTSLADYLRYLAGIQSSQYQDKLTAPDQAAIAAADSILNSELG